MGKEDLAQMKRLATRAAILALAGWPAFAGAAQWQVVSVAADRSIYSDRASVMRNGERVQVWERIDYLKLQPGERTGEKFGSVQSLFRYDCARRTAVPVAHAYHHADGSLLRKVDVEGLEPPRVVEPKSLRAQLLEIACKPQAPVKPAATKFAAAGAPKAIAASRPEIQKSGDAKTKIASESADDKPMVKAAFDKPAATEIKPRRPTPRAAAPKRSAMRKAAPKPTCSDVCASKTNAQIAPKSHGSGDWSYSGDSGPQNWARLSPDYAQCAHGQRQSPIDIRDGARLNLAPIEIDYQPVPLRIVDNGHTVQINYDAGSSIRVQDTRYELKQIHFHNPAEEVVNGKAFSLSAHFVHESADKRLAVVAALFEPGEENAFLSALWAHLPLEPHREIVLASVRLDWTELLPADRRYYTYMGSLTTPPCSEGVLWLVMKTPLLISPEQINVFARLYVMNARPVQESNGRLIKESL